MHSGDVCVQLYSDICRPFIISGQLLHKHSCTNISVCLLPLLLQFYLSLSALHSHNPTSFFPLSSSLPKPPPPPTLVSARHLLFPPLTLFSLLIHPSPPTVCLWVENTIIYSFVSPSVPMHSIYTGKYQVASWKEILYGVMLINQSSLLPVVFSAITWGSSRFCFAELPIAVNTVALLITCFYFHPVVQMCVVFVIFS